MPTKLILASMILSAAAMAQAVVVLPPGADLAEQNSTTTGQPLTGMNALAGTGAPGRTQYVYDASNFTSLGINTPVLISKLRFRANGVAATWTGGTIGNLQLDLSTSTADYLQMTNTFQSNHGFDRLTVWNSSVVVQAGTSTAATTGTAPGGTFVAELDLLTGGTPFAYNPALGDLCLDFMSGGATGALTGQLPAWDTLTTTPAAALARRSFTNIGQFAATGTTPATNAVVVEVTYYPLTGIFAAFAANVRAGTSPLTVQFTDQSSSSLGPITTWAWDFENDGIDDDFTPNPTHVFPCGSHTVKLTVGDGTSTLSVVRPAFIVTDLVTPSFTWVAAPAPGFPGRVQFTDTTTPAATAWAWDFDGDNIVDSTVQNPTWDFVDYLPHNVALTASRACAAGSTVTNRVVAGNQFLTTMTSTSAGTTNWTLLCDFDVLNPFGVELKAADLNMNASSGNPVTVDVYVTPVTCVGVERTSTAWRKVATASGIAAGSGQRSMLSFDHPVYLAPGTYGFLLHGVVGGVNYTSTATTYGNADLTMSNARVLGGLFPATGTIFQPRTWCGALHYATHGSSSEASYGYFGSGCAGSFNVARTRAVTQPSVGTTFLVDFSNLPNDAVFAIWGWSRTNSAFGPLPYDLTPFGMPGCSALVSGDFTQLLLGAPSSATASFAFGIPNWSILLGAQFYLQGLALDVGWNPLGATMSDAGAGVIGL